MASFALKGTPGESLLVYTPVSEKGQGNDYRYGKCESNKNTGNNNKRTAQTPTRSCVRIYLTTAIITCSKQYHEVSQGPFIEGSAQGLVCSLWRHSRSHAKHNSALIKRLSAERSRARVWWKCSQWWRRASAVFVDGCCCCCRCRLWRLSLNMSVRRGGFSTVHYFLKRVPLKTRIGSLKTLLLFANRSRTVQVSERSAISPRSNWSWNIILSFHQHDKDSERKLRDEEKQRQCPHQG